MIRGRFVTVTRGTTSWPRAAGGAAPLRWRCPAQVALPRSGGPAVPRAAGTLTTCFTTTSGSILTAGLKSGGGGDDAAAHVSIWLRSASSGEQPIQQAAERRRKARSRDDLHAAIRRARR